MHYAIIVLLVLLSGGVSYASESALPGNPLYSVKIGVNESVRLGLAGSVQAKAQLDADLAGRRLEETEKLVVQTKLNADASAQVTENFQRHSDSVEARIREFADTDLSAAADIASNFETSLEAHDQVLAQLMAKTTDAENKTEQENVRAKIQAEHQDTSDLREELEARIAGQNGPDVQAAAEGRMKAAENKIAEVKKFIENQKARIGVTATVDAQAQLAVAEKTFADGSAKFDAGAYGEAFVLFSSAHRLAQQAKMLVELGLNLGVEIHATAAGAAEEARMDKAGVEARMRANVESGTTTAPGLNVNGGAQGEINVQIP